MITLLRAIFIYDVIKTRITVINDEIDRGVKLACDRLDKIDYICYATLYNVLLYAIKYHFDY